MMAGIVQPASSNAYPSTYLVARRDRWILSFAPESRGPRPCADGIAADTDAQALTFHLIPAAHGVSEPDKSSAAIPIFTAPDNWRAGLSPIEPVL